jgi:hypothetical protein
MVTDRLEDFPIFSGAGKSTMKTLQDKLDQYLCNIASVLRIKAANEITYHPEVLYAMFDRVEMRRIYFHVFHNGMEMGELNEGCLICFWILKFMPFRHGTFSNVALNVKVAMCLFLNMLTYIASKEGKLVNKRAEVMNELMYTFQYRDLSKEALMILAKSLIRNK